MESKSNRISIMIDKKLEGHLRDMQASMIKKLKKNVSFSEVVNLVLNKGMQK